MEKEIQTILQRDAAAAKKIASIRAKVEPQLGAAKSMAASVKQYEAKVQKLKGDLGALEAEMKKEMQATVRAS